MRSPATLSAQLRRVALLSVGALSLQAAPVSAWAQSAPASLRACAAESDPAQRLACYDKQMARLSAPKSAPQVAAPTSSPKVIEPIRSSAPRPSTAPPPISARSAAPHESSPVTAHITRLERSPDALVLHLDNGQVWQQIGRASGDLSLREGDPVSIEKHLGSHWLSSRYVSNMQVRQQTGPQSLAPMPAPAQTQTPPMQTTKSAPSPASHWSTRWKHFADGSGAHLTAHIARLERSPDTMVLHLDNGQVWQQIGRASGDLSLHEGDQVTIEKHLGSYWLSSRYVSNMRVRLEPQ